MSSWKEPVGEKGKRVYVRRRIAVLIGILAFIAAIVLVVIRPGASEETVERNSVEVPKDLVQIEQGDKKDEKKSGDPEQIPACTTAQLQVLPITDASSYGPDQEPMLSLSIENTGKADCVAELGTAGMKFEITSGSDQIWRSTDCQKDADHRSVVLKPGEAEMTEPIPWNRERSGTETCEMDREKVVAGGASYHLKVTAAGVDSRSTAQFQLY